MGLAVLILCHRNPFMVNALIDALRHPDVDFCVHVDAKSDIASKIRSLESVYVLGSDERVSVRWGDVSQVMGILALARAAFSVRGGYDYLWLVSGQDYPLRPIGAILQWLESHNGCDLISLMGAQEGRDGRNTYEKRCEIAYPRWVIGNAFWQRVAKRLLVAMTGGWGKTWKLFLRRDYAIIRPLHFGSGWWCLRSDVVRWMLDYLDENPRFLEFYESTLCPDESFFQTLYMRSPYREKRMDNLLHQIWCGGSNPKTLSKDDAGQAVSSCKLIARKWDFSGPEDEAYRALLRYVE